MDRSFDEKINIDFINDVKINKKMIKTKNYVALCIIPQKTVYYYIYVL